MTKRKRFDVMVKIDGRWNKQTGTGNRWGNEGFSKTEKTKLVKRLQKLGIKRSTMRVKIHIRGK